MSTPTLLANLMQRRLGQMFPRFFAPHSTKHDHYKDFGWPETLTFDHFYRMYTRNGLAKAGVNQTISKTWQDDPEIWETEKPKETELEANIRQRFSDLRIWQSFAEADRRSMVGRYSGVLLRFRDDRKWDQPVDRAPGGLEGLAGVIPVWEGQLTVTDWSNDPDREDYGSPRMYQYEEAAVGNDNKGGARSIAVHPDRILIWSDDGTIDCLSALEAGYNDLLDAEKIKGAGGEGFWKTSRGAPVIEAPDNLSAKDVADAMGVDVGGLPDALNEQLDSFQSGFDKGLMLGGMKATPLTISLPQPEHFFAAPVRLFAASLGIPEKILMGNQTGERASTEDADSWALTCMGRRNTRNIPLIREFLSRLERVGILPERDWTVGWSDLTEANAEDKLSRAVKMAEINQKAGLDAPFLDDEIREAAGYDPMTADQRAAQGYDDLSDDEDITDE